MYMYHTVSVFRHIGPRPIVIALRVPPGQVMNTFNHCMGTLFVFAAVRRYYGLLLFTCSKNGVEMSPSYM